MDSPGHILNYCDEMIAKKTSEYLFFKYKGDALAILNRSSDAIAAYRKSYELKQDEVTAHALAESIAKSAECTPTVQNYENLISLSPDSIHLLCIIGEAFFDKFIKKYPFLDTFSITLEEEASLKLLLGTIMDAGQLPDSVLGERIFDIKVRMLHVAGKYKESIDLLEPSIVRCSLDYRCFELSLLYKKTGNEKAALKYYDMIKDLGSDPKEVENRYRKFKAK